MEGKNDERGNIRQPYEPPTDAVDDARDGLARHDRGDLDGGGREIASLGSLEHFEAEGGNIRDLLVHIRVVDGAAKVESQEPHVLAGRHERAAHASEQVPVHEIEGRASCGRVACELDDLAVHFVAEFGNIEASLNDCLDEGDGL